METRHRITSDDSAALIQSLASAGERDAAWMTTSAVSLAALTLALPLHATGEGGVRIIAALLLALAAGWLAVRCITAWRTIRAQIWPLPSVTGLEPGERKLSFSLESVREISDLGERVFRWRAFIDAAETDDWIALRVSDRECLVLPRAVLSERGLAESETLAALIGRGRR